MYLYGEKNMKHKTLRLKPLDGMTTVTIAEKMNMTPQGVLRILNSALQKILRGLIRAGYSKQQLLEHIRRCENSSNISCTFYVNSIYLRNRH